MNGQATEERASEVRVVDAALRLAMSRERVIRLVQAHKIRGRRDPWTGWLVDVSSIEAFLAKQASETPARG